MVTLVLVRIGTVFVNRSGNDRCGFFSSGQAMLGKARLGYGERWDVRQ